MGGGGGVKTENPLHSNESSFIAIGQVFNVLWVFLCDPKSVLNIFEFYDLYESINNNNNNNNNIYIYHILYNKSWA